MKKIFKFSLKNLIFSGICTLLIIVLSIISGSWNPLSSLDNKITDGIYQHKDETALEINIVGIDDETIEKYHAYNPVEYRQYFADILNNWASKGLKPSAIGFDVIFNSTYGCDLVDIELSNAMKKHNVVLGVNGASRTEAPYGLSKTIYEGASKVGYVDALTDDDEAVRRTYLRGPNYDSLAYAIYSMYAKNNGIKQNEYNQGEAYYFKYYGAPELNYTGDGKVNNVISSFNYIPLWRLIEGEFPSIRHSENSIVIFGSYASAVDTGLSNDIYNSPIGEMFGMEIQCNIIQSLMNDEIYSPVSIPVYTIINAVVIFIIAFLMSSLAFYIGMVAFGLGIGSEFLLMIIMHANKTYHFIALPLFILILAFIFLVIEHYYSEYRHKKEVIGTFKRYISPDVAEALVEKQSEAMSLGGKKRRF